MKGISNFASEATESSRLMRGAVKVRNEYLPEQLYWTVLDDSW